MIALLGLLIVVKREQCFNFMAFTQMLPPWVQPTPTLSLRWQSSLLSTGHCLEYMEASILACIPAYLTLVYLHTGLPCSEIVACMHSSLAYQETCRPLPHS